MLTNSIQTAQLHSDELGEWVVIDDGPEFTSALLVPASFEHRQLVSRDDAARRFPAVVDTPAELAAIRRAFEALDPLDQAGRVRAMRWLLDRLGVDATVRPSLRPAPPKSDRAGREAWLQEMWVADVPLSQLAEGLGLAVGSVNQMVFRMRRDGWDLPQRKRRPHGQAA